jgi:hypothetical protein
MRRSIKGFLFIELTAALSLGAVFLVSAGIFFSGFVNAAIKIVEETTKTRQFQQAVRRIQDDLDAFLFFDFSGSGPKSRSLRGGESGIVLLTERGGEIVWVTYQMEKTGIPRQFRLRRETSLWLNVASPPVKKTDEQILFTECGNIRFSYGRKDEIARSVTWENKWEEADPPALVRLTVETKNKKRTRECLVPICQRIP